MAALDKIYIDNYNQYLQFKVWCEKQPPLEDKYGNKVRIGSYLYSYNDPFEGFLSFFMAPYYVDAYVIRNCPIESIQEELMVNYGHWNQKRIKQYYEDIKNWSGEGECPYWAKLEDFTFYEDGTITLNGIEKSDYERIKDGELYTSPKRVDYVYGKHFRCTEHPKYHYNRPFLVRYWFIDIEIPKEYDLYMWYHPTTRTWDFSDEFVLSDKYSSTAHCRTIRALKRLMLKWKLPIGTIVRATGRYTFDEYEFIIKK